MEKKKADYRLGIHAKHLLLMAFPLIIIQLVAFIAYLLPLDGGELIKNQQFIFSVSDAIGRGIIFTVGGTLILDYMEKKHRKEKRN